MAKDTALLSTSQVSRLLNLHCNSVYRLIRSKELPAIRVGGVWRFRRDDVGRYLHARQVFDPVPEEIRPQSDLIGPATEAMRLQLLKVLQPKGDAHRRAYRCFYTNVVRRMCLNIKTPEMRDEVLASIDSIDLDWCQQAAPKLLTKAPVALKAMNEVIDAQRGNTEPTGFETDAPVGTGDDERRGDGPPDIATALHG